MPELPELQILKEQLHAFLAGNTATQVEVCQAKVLNVPVDDFTRTVTGRHFASVTRRGKWLDLAMDDEYHVLLNLNMGAELWHYTAGTTLPKKYHFRLELHHGDGLTCRFFWMGFIHLVKTAQLSEHKQTAKLGPDPLEIGTDDFMLIARMAERKPAKALILDQDKLSGIGNAYAHDILWQARIHPDAKLGTLSDEQLASYHHAIGHVLQRALDMGGLDRDFYRNGANWEELFYVGYKENRPCPVCGTPITKIKTGSTTTYICPACQPKPG